MNACLYAFDILIKHTKKISYEDDLIEASNSFLRYVRSN